MIFFANSTRLSRVLFDGDLNRLLLYSPVNVGGCMIHTPLIFGRSIYMGGERALQHEGERLNALGVQGVGV